MKGTYTRGKRAEMTPFDRELARIYDRLRKQDQRTQTYMALEFDSSTMFGRPRLIEDTPSPYLRGVKDTLDAIRELGDIVL